MSHREITYKICINTLVCIPHLFISFSLNRLTICIIKSMFIFSFSFTSTFIFLSISVFHLLLHFSIVHLLNSIFIFIFFPQLLSPLYFLFIPSWIFHYHHPHLIVFFPFLPSLFILFIPFIFLY